MAIVEPQRADVNDPLAGGRRRALPLTVAAGFAALYLPFVGLGYGTDIDQTNVLRAGASILDGDYHYGRPPGAFPHELITGLLDRVGGSVAVNIGSVAMAVIVLIGLGHLIERRHGERAGVAAVVIMGTQPWFWVAAVSLGDFVYALALLLVGIDCAQRHRRVVAGLLFATAIGMRSTTAVLVLAYLLAEVSGGSSDDDMSLDHSELVKDHWRRALLTGAVTAVGAVAWFIPPWLSAGRSAEFLQNQFVAGDLGVMAARWGVKNVAFFGVPLIVLLVVRAPILMSVLRQFRSKVLVRFAVFASLFAELMFLRFPWKPIHLLPVMVAVTILIAVSPRRSNRLVAAVVVCNLSLALVSVSVAEPDVADAATTGYFTPGFTRGVIVNEIDCRLNPEEPDAWDDVFSEEADLAAIRAFACQARSWRAGKGPSTLDPGP